MKQQNPYIKVRYSKLHGKGLFAKKNIKKGTYIIEYIGEIVSKKQGNLRAEKQFKNSEKNKNHGSVYVFELDRYHDLDGNIKENIARFINHSCDPNCRFTIRNKQIWIIAKKNIKTGQEIFYDYGYDLESFANHPCYCGSKDCMGYILSKESKKELMKILIKKSKK